jgi:rhodanese-related sulfurtransferase
MKSKLLTSGIVAAVALFLSSVPVEAGCGKCGAGHKKGAEKECSATCGGGKHKCAASDKECCGKCDGKQAAARQHGEINVEALEALIDSNAKVVVLDARTGEYDDGRRIPGAKSLAPDAGEKEVRKLIGSKKQLVVTYCSNTQCPASSKLAHRLSELGYENVVELPVGIQGWSEADKKVEKVN